MRYNNGDIVIYESKKEKIFFGLMNKKTEDDYVYEYKAGGYINKYNLKDFDIFIVVENYLSHLVLKRYKSNDDKLLHIPFSTQNKFRLVTNTDMNRIRKEKLKNLCLK